MELNSSSSKGRAPTFGILCFCNTCLSEPRVWGQHRLILEIYLGECAVNDIIIAKPIDINL
jgi:hypothetical protein